MTIQPKIARLRSQLSVTGLQKKDNPLFQVIDGLIRALEQSQAATVEGIADAGGDVSDEPFLTYTTASTDLANSKQLLAGTNIIFTDNTTSRTISTTTIPADISAEPYITHTTASGLLTNSRRLVAGTNISFVDTTTTRTVSSTSGPDVTAEPFITHTTASGVLTNSKRLVAGSNIIFVDTTTTRTISTTTFPVDISNLDFITHSDESASLPNSRELLAGTGVIFDDTVANERTVSVDADSPGAQVYRNTDLTVTDATPTIIDFTHELVDDDSYWAIGSPSHVVVPESAWYAVIGQAATDETNAGAFNVSLELNGTTIRNGQTVGTPAITNDGLQKVSVGAILKLTAADFLELSVEINTGGATSTIKGGQNNTFIQIVKIAVSGSGSGGGATPSIAITNTTAPATLNLTTEGTIDWLDNAGTTTVPRTTTSNAKSQGDGWLVRGFDWIAGGGTFFTQNFTLATTSGTDDSLQNALASNVGGGGVFKAAGVHIGFRIIVPAFETPRTLRIYLSGFSAVVTIAARLDKNLGSVVTDSFDTGAATAMEKKVTITYNSANDGDYLSVMVTMTTNRGSTPNVKFKCATLAES